MVTASLLVFSIVLKYQSPCPLTVVCTGMIEEQGFPCTFYTGHPPSPFEKKILGLQPSLV
jgi:hypothetical protein